MRVLNLLTGGNIGGIETLCKDYGNFSEHENIMALLWGSGPLADEMKLGGVEVLELNASTKNVLSTVKKVLNVCGDRKVEAVIVHHAAPMAHLCLMAVKIKYPHMITIAYAHGNAEDMCRAKDKNGLRMRKMVIAHSLKKADKVVAISTSVKRSLIYLFGIPEEKINVVYNGVDTKKFTAQWHEPNRPVRIIFVGRLIQEKGVQVVLEGLSRLSENVNYRFSIVGDGPYRNKLEKLAGKLNISDRIEFLGSRRDVPELLKASDLFVHMPVWEEGFGITIIEAMAAGLICICAKSGAIPEIISDGENGFLVEKDRTAELANTLEHVIEGVGGEEYEKICEKAVETASRFSVFNFVRELDKIIGQV